MRKVTVSSALLCLLFVFQIVFASTPPQAIKGLVYDASLQNLVTAGVPDEGEVYYYRNLYTGEWDKNVPSMLAAGTYDVEYLRFVVPEDAPDAVPENSQKGKTITGITIERSTAELENGPKAYWNLKYDGTVQKLVEKEGEVETSSGTKYYYFRTDDLDGDWGTQRPEAREVGYYDVEYLISAEKPDKNVQGIFIYDIPIKKGDGSLPPSGTDPVNPPKPPRPVNPSSYSNGSINLYWFESDEDKVLPGTGFPTRVHTPLSIQPESLAYTNLDMRIQIPTINTDVELTGVPESGDSWAVEWLGDRAGVLSGTYLPGDGYSIVAAHNHLNDMEIGPFALLYTLEENDRIFVNTADGGLTIFSVYANELLRPDDMTKLSSIAGQEENSMVLVTCENEMVEGGYQNRRAVFARPLF